MSTAAVVSAAAALGAGVAGAGTASATSASGPSIGATVSSPGGTFDGDGFVLRTPLNDSGVAAVTIAYTVTPGHALTALSLDCGIPGKKAVNLLTTAPAPGPVTGTAECDYTTTGGASLRLSATDDQDPGVTSTSYHPILVHAGTKAWVDQYDGASRYGTGIAVSRAAFPEPGSAGAVVLARGDMFADALAGIPLAKYKNGPLLLTPGGVGAKYLNPDVANELTRVLPRDKSHTVYILGGTGAISQQIEDYISGVLGYNVVRLQGGTRYQTALAIAEDPRGLDNPTHVVVARGDDFADALAAGPFASNIATDGDGKPGAIVLTDGPSATASVDAQTAAYIEARFAADPGKGLYQTVTAIGGGADTAVERLDGATAPGNRFWGLYGQTRFETAASVAMQGWGVNGADLSSPVVGVATGMSFPDALTGGAYMALKNGPLLLSETETLPAPAAAAIHSGPGMVIGVELFGGHEVLTSGVVNGIAVAVQPKTVIYTDHKLVF